MIHISMSRICYSAPTTGSIPLPEINEFDEDVQMQGCLQTDSYKLISCHQVEQYCNHQFGFFDNVVILDARFEYEFQGGHITGAFNIRSVEDMIKIYERFKDQNVLIICHCEYSKHRGPGLAMMFREYDRKQHSDNYPSLSFPELYVLEGGYRNFYRKYPDLCVGGYRKMRDKNFNRELKRCHSAYRNCMESACLNGGLHYLKRSKSVNLSSPDFKDPIIFKDYDSCPH